MSNLDFDILIDNSFAELCDCGELSPIDNKTILSVINNFEDGEWRYQHFQNFIWDNIALTALSHRERESLTNKSHTKLVEAAKKLRLLDESKVDVGKGSEIAEIILYAIMHHHYNALPVVPKIFYKQNVNDYAKGADSVHIVVDTNGEFSIWYGEAKFYKTIENADLDKIIQSVSNSLDTAKLKKENSIISGVSDLDGLIDDKALEEEIRRVLATTTSIDELKPILHIPILLLHECKITAGYTEMSAEYKKELKEHYKERVSEYFKKQITKLGTIHNYAKIRFHLILFPVPSKEKVVDRFINMAKVYKDQ